MTDQRCTSGCTSGRTSDLNPASPLRGLRVLTTRPAHQSAGILAQLRALGADADNFPTIEIVSLAADDERLRRIGEYDLAIFISGNAVAYGLAALARVGAARTALPPAVAVGRGTAALLAAAGVAGAAYPAQPSSEALLEVPVVKALAPASKVIVFRGRGGKEVIAAGLRARGIAVDYAQVYARRKPLASLSLAEPRDLILVTSRDGLRNLYELTEAASRARLLQTRIVLGSRSMLDLHRELRFERDPICAASPLDDDMTAAVAARCRR